MKLAIIVGTRPEIIRLSRIIAVCRDHFKVTLIHTGQNFDKELSAVFFDQLKIGVPDVYLNSAGNSLGQTMGEIITRSYEELKLLQPDAVLILGDTDSALSAISAKRLKIPIFHMEAGNRCFDECVPEEINRKIVDHISDVNLPYSQIARQYLLREGVAPDRIIVTGSPLKEVINYYSSQIENSKVLHELNLKAKNYLVVSAHRSENVDSLIRIRQLHKLIEGVSNYKALKVIFSVHPRTLAKIHEAKLIFSDNIKLCKPFGYFDYLKLQKNSAAVLSDSGTITEESDILGFNAVNIRDIHERPEGFEAGCPALTGMDINLVKSALDRFSGLRQSELCTPAVRDYNVDCVSSKIVNIISSYTHVVNKYTWRKLDV